MGALTGCGATSSGYWSTEWKRGAVARSLAPAEKEGSMGDDLLATFFARYPSALGSTHAGGQYRIICPECGHLVAVSALDEATDRLSIHCDNCDYDDELSKPLARAADPAA